jgi:chromosome segregation ATPase
MQSWGFSPSSFLVCLVGWTGSALLGGCLVAPTTGELEQAASSSSNKAIAKASQAAEKAKEEYGEEIRAASRDLATLARATSELVAVAKESPERFAAATTEKDEVQNTVRTLAHLGKSFDRAIEVADNNTAAFRAAVVGLKDDLAQEHGVLNTQRKAFMEDFRKEREAVFGELQQERAEILKQVDVLSAKLLDQAARKVADLIQNALGLLIVLVLVLWGLPFGAGVFVGRLMKKKN